MEYEELISNFKYNNDTGLLNRITRKNSNGSKDKFGYLIIKYNIYHFLVTILSHFTEIKGGVED